VHAGGQDLKRRQRTFQQHTITGARYSQSYLVTQVLLAVNILVYVLTVVQAKSLNDNWISRVEQLGGLDTKATLGNDEWWRLVTYGFLHAGLIHIAANMFSLWMMGRALEPVFGKARFAALYFVSMLGGAVAVVLSDQGAVGASGAILGLLGSYAVLVVRLRLNPTILIVNLALSAYITFGVSNVSILGHVGGLVTGALVTAVLVYGPERNQVTRQAAGIAVVVAVLAGLIAYKSTQVPATDTCGFYPYRDPGLGVVQLYDCP